MLGLPVATVLADHAIGHVTVPGGEVVNAGLEAAATITDIDLIDPPMSYERKVIHNAPEQLVEGHTVFVTWDIPLVPNVTNWTADILGNVECQVHQNTTGEYWMGIPVPRRINEAHAECRAAGTVIVTPDPFYDSDNTFQSQMTPTGTYIPFSTSDGQTGYVTEYVYELTTMDWMGNEQTQTLYAWRTPILDPWMHEGETKRWICPIPHARLIEMGISTFRVQFDDDLAHLLPEE